ncbi:MAG: uroporphyrinogen-III C-methyltransferase [Alphaproteobacteria bacterium]|nr:uroporphyrinogen-III C-methyltransferase [Alphaproteobacteria bacterium]
MTNHLEILDNPASAGREANPYPARVQLVGAGPGDPELLTLKAVRALQTADVILYDELVNRCVLDLANPRARQIHVGKRGGGPSWKQRDIHELILAHAFGGRGIVRLKGGDPFVFGRGGEELAALREAGLEVEVIPGITAAVAAAASTQIPLTHRQLSRTVTFLSGAGPGHGLPEFTHIDLEALNDGLHTVAVYMAVKTSHALGTTLIGAGWDPETPVLAIENATRHQERRVRASIRDLAERPEALALKSPAILLIGRVAGLPVHGQLDVIETANTKRPTRELAYA